MTEEDWINDATVLFERHGMSHRSAHETAKTCYINCLEDAAGSNGEMVTPAEGVKIELLYWEK